MMLKFTLALLLLSTSNGAGTDNERKASYLRRLKKDSWSYWSKNTKEQGEIYTEMMNSISDAIESTSDLPIDSASSESDDSNDKEDTEDDSVPIESVDPSIAKALVRRPTDLPTNQPTDLPTNHDNFNDAKEEEVWNHGATAVSARKTGTITFKIPDNTAVGDTLFLFLSRTDHVLPLYLPGWNRGAECFKSRNQQRECFRALHCIERDGPYCRAFRRGDESGDGRDLATVVYYRHVEENDPCEWTLNIRGGTTTWAIVVSIPNVNREKPILHVAGTSCDRKMPSIFPSVYGENGDVALFSQCFDDTAVLNQFQPPSGTVLMGWTNEEDEAGFVYGKQLTQSGLTGQLITQGPGGPNCKDALLSVIVNID